MSYLLSTRILFCLYYYYFYCSYNSSKVSNKLILQPLKLTLLPNPRGHEKETSTISTSISPERPCGASVRAWVWPCLSFPPWVCLGGGWRVLVIDPLFTCRGTRAGHVIWVMSGWARVWPPPWLGMRCNCILGGANKVRRKEAAAGGAGRERRRVD